MFAVILEVRKTEDHLRLAGWGDRAAARGSR
jgi:hypothetical protein